MRVYHGSSISNIVKHIAHPSRNHYPNSHIYVTDTPERAMNYANAQATGEVVEGVETLTEHAALIEIETPSVKWFRRPDDHPTLDKCEATVTDFVITKITMRPGRNNTLYGTRWTGYRTAGEVIEALRFRGIEVEVI